MRDLQTFEWLSHDLIVEGIVIRLTRRNKFFVGCQAHQRGHILQQQMLKTPMQTLRQVFSHLRQRQTDGTLKSLRGCRAMTFDHNPLQA
jgi:hypothetical protein